MPRRVYCEDCNDDNQLFKNQYQQLFDDGWGIKCGNIYCLVCIMKNEVKNMVCEELEEITLTFTISTPDSRIERRIANSQSINPVARANSIEGWGESFFMYQEVDALRSIGNKIIDSDSRVRDRAIQMVSDCCSFEKGINIIERKDFFEDQKNHLTVRYLLDNLGKIRKNNSKDEVIQKNTLIAIMDLVFAITND
jgi:hypothetical protein